MSAALSPVPLSRELGLQPYVPVWQAMREHTAARGAHSPDELWLVQHPPVYTLGLAGRSEHLLRDNGIERVHIDRGGQVTYHGPGQAIVYLLLDLARRQLKVRELVALMEDALIATLADYGIAGERRTGAPGVYVGPAKIAALGLKISRGCSYHGLALNVDMDLAPFADINPCGYAGLATTQVSDCGVRTSVTAAQQHIATHLVARLTAHYPIAPTERNPA